MSRPSAPPLGNDVVDTTHRRCRGKADDDRFLGRVLTATEREVVLGDHDPDRTLWLHWAAKEAAFKAATTVRGEPPVFEHAAFAVDLAGTVVWEGLTFHWREWDSPPGGGVHVVCWHEPPEGPTGLVGATDACPVAGRIPLDRLSPRERASVRSPASAWVRLRARGDLARLADVEERRLEIVTEGGPPGRTPPRALLDGETAPWAVSLSHHGRLVAWALAPFPAAGPRAEAPSAQNPGGR